MSISPNPNEQPAPVKRTRRGHGRHGAANGGIAGQLSLVQERVIETLLSGVTQRETAARCGVGSATVARWVNRDGPFRTAYLAAKEARAAAAKAALEQSAAREAELSTRARMLSWEETVAHLEALKAQRVNHEMSEDGKTALWVPSAYAALKLGELAIKLSEIGDPKAETERARLEAMSPEDRAREFQASVRAMFGIDTAKPAVPSAIEATG